MVDTEGYVTMEDGQIKTIPPNMVRVEILSSFIGHDRRVLEPGERVTLPRALALSQCLIGTARELTPAELAEEAPKPTPPETVETRDPTLTTREPRVRKR
jgi:hypothetical protein